MIFKDLINKHNWQDVKDTLERIYKDEDDNIDDYLPVFLRLKEMEGMETDITLYIEPFEVDPDEMEDGLTNHGHHHVYGKHPYPPDEEEYVVPEFIRIIGREPDEESEADLSFLKILRCDKYGLEYLHWGGWLNFVISEETLSRYSELEITAYCIYEMTWCGCHDGLYECSVKELVEIYKKKLEAEEIADKN